MHVSSAQDRLKPLERGVGWRTTGVPSSIKRSGRKLIRSVADPARRRLRGLERSDAYTRFDCKAALDDYKRLGEIYVLAGTAYPRDAGARKRQCEQVLAFRSDMNFLHAPGCASTLVSRSTPDFSRLLTFRP